MCLASNPSRVRSVEVQDGLGAGVAAERLNEIEMMIHKGFLFQKAGLEYDFCLREWLALGQEVERWLGKEANDARVYQYYLPVYFWLEKMVTRTAKAAARKGGAVVLGISCPQGGGKTTLTRFLKDMFTVRGLHCVSASLDDFYWTHKDQRRLAERHHGNDLMEFRGMPGTHDMNLLLDTLHALRKGEPADIPRYDKSAYRGRGDRVERGRWTAVDRDVKVAILEGWCLGFEPVDSKKMVTADQRLHPVNEYLRSYLCLKDLLDAMVVMQVDDVRWVYNWREESEMHMREAGRDSLSKDDVKDFVRRFMPAYELFLPQLYSHEFLPGRELRLKIDQRRRPVS